MSQIQGIRIGRVFSIPIYLDLSWIVIFGLITYNLSDYFAQQHPKWTSTQNWTVGIVASVLFFASVLFHELSHSVVAQHYKIKVLSITLFIFGGLARIGREPTLAIQEFNIAVAGPLSSGFLAGMFYLISLASTSSPMTEAITTYLAGANGLLALFNLLPGFPMDGGRIFRALVWGTTKDFSRATRVAGWSGKLIAYGLIACAIWSALHR